MEGSEWPVVVCSLSAECTPELAEIERESNQPPWSEALFQNEFSNRYSLVYGARLHGRLVGFLVCHVVLDEAHIVNFAVSKAWRRRGIGSALLKHVLRELAAKAVLSVVLEVRRSNNAARRLYEKLGFNETAVRQGYYSSDQEDAVFMNLNLLHFIGRHGAEKSAGLPLSLPWD